MIIYNSRLFIMSVALSRSTLGQDSVQDLCHQGLAFLAVQEPLDHGLDALAGVLAHHVDLDIDLIAQGLGGHDHAGLGISDHHDREGALDVVDVNDGQGGTVQADEALGDNVVHQVLVLLRDLEDKGDGVAVVSAGQDLDGRVDVALDHVAAEAGVGVHGALEIDGIADLQGSWKGKERERKFFF